MIAGFESPTEGAIRLEGVDVSRVPPYKRNVNTVFQHYALFPHMTVWDNIAYVPRSTKQDKADVGRRVDEIIDIAAAASRGHRESANRLGDHDHMIVLIGAGVAAISSKTCDRRPRLGRAMRLFRAGCGA